jgi:hypothetical protein
VQNKLKGGDYKMTNKNSNFNSNEKDSSAGSTKQSEFPNSSNFKSVERLPESSRPRRDGPGGEDGD